MTKSGNGEALAAYATEINMEFMIVLGFYFAAPHLDKFLPSKKK